MLTITSISQFNKIKASGLLIIDFYAVWCGPCKVISPVFEKLAKQHESTTSVIFAKVDVDKAQDVAQACGITAMPTFQFFMHGKKVDEVRGADVQQLTTKVGFYTAALTKENAGEEAKAGGFKENAKGTTSGPGSLRSMIDISSSKMLNASNLSSIRNIVSPPPAGYAIASASGARLLIYLSFTQPVSPSHIKITMAKDSMSNAPSRIQIGTNIVHPTVKANDRPVSNDISMDSLAKADNLQSFNIYSDEYIHGTAEIKLKTSKFTAIRNLMIRIDANISGEETTPSKLGEIDIIGSAL